MDYKEAWDLQELMLKETVELKVNNRNANGAGIPTTNHFLFVEHPHVYTLGKSGDPANLLRSPEQLREDGIAYYKINRGGDITYHGPGQIVGYPILDLENFKTDINWFLRNLEEACILTLSEYGIEAGRVKGLTGVWIEGDGNNPRKIMAIGVRCSRWVTMHGFAFNVNTNLSLFENIIPCGIEDKGVTSLQKELGMKMDMEEVKSKMRNHLGACLEFEWEIQSEIKA